MTNTKVNSNYDPNIIAFVCNWCAFGAIESAGATDRKYPPSVKVIRVMCSSRVDRQLILKSMRNGVDGVIVCACNLGNCHYMDGNDYAKQRVEATSNLFGNLGMSSNRIKFQEIRASEGNRLADILTDFYEEIKTLGPK